MGILKNIEWTDTNSNLIVWKYPITKDQINKGSALTVRESQVAIFIDKGRLADVFLPVGADGQSGSISHGFPG